MSLMLYGASGSVFPHVMVAFVPARPRASLATLAAKAEPESATRTH